MCPHWKAGIFLSTLCSSLGSPHSGTAFLGFVLLQGKSIYLQSLTMGLQFLCCRINCIDQPSSAPVQPALLYNHKPLTAARPVLRLKESAVGIQPGLPIWSAQRPQNHHGFVVCLKHLQASGHSLIILNHGANLTQQGKSDGCSLPGSDFCFF